MFGNVPTLTCGEALAPEFAEYDIYYAREPLWNPIIKQLGMQRRLDVDAGLPITCQKHKNITHIYESGDWATISGGCREKCGELLECGHECPNNCHPFDHERLECQEPCSRTVALCGHPCSATCGASCFCDQCKVVNILSEADSNKMLKDAYVNDSTQAAPAWLSRNGIFGSYDVRNEDQYSPTSSPPKDRITSRGYMQTSPPRAFEAVSTTQDWTNYSKNAHVEDEAIRKVNVVQEKTKPEDLVFDETYVETVVDKHGERVVVGRKNTEINTSPDDAGATPDLGDFPELEAPVVQKYTKPRPFRHPDRVTASVLKILPPGQKAKKPTLSAKYGNRANSTSSSRTQKSVSPATSAKDVATSMSKLAVTQAPQDGPSQQYIGYTRIPSGQLIDIPALKPHGATLATPTQGMDLLDLGMEPVAREELSGAPGELDDLIDF
jgi:hypothetical protein